ncbi:MAG: UvrD-helicase domain-containing protein [Gordonibacter sp.]|nr:UvrD-helicase domain-containing protein [Gordonibacter sp.]
MHDEQSSYAVAEANRLALVSPAGFGKTELICSLVDECDGKALVLTHTRAGVTALRKRFAKNGISSAQATVTTIAGYCEFWASSYPSRSGFTGFSYMRNLKSKENEYYRDLYIGATQVVSSGWAQRVIRTSYKLIVVDEYQDCTQTQQELILALSKEVMLRVLGDPMQGIFYWIKDEDLVDWKNLSFPYDELKSKPWRWINSGHPNLGEVVSSIRNDLIPTLTGHSVNVDLYSYGDGIHLISKESISKGALPREVRESQSVLFLTGTIRQQLSFARQTFGFQCEEKIDPEELIALADAVDNSAGPELCLSVLSFCKLCFTKVTENLGSYISRLEKGSVDFSRIRKLPHVGAVLSKIATDGIPYDIAILLKSLRAESEFRVYRASLISEAISVLDDAVDSGRPIREEMDNRRLGIQQGGHNRYRFTSSRTVLSKGLEYETVLVDASSITDARDFYVAISRCTMDLYVISDSPILHFNGIDCS